MNSMVDGLPLPKYWDDMRTYYKGLVIRMLQEIAKTGSRFTVSNHREAFRLWSEIPREDRIRIRRHLEAVGSLQIRPVARPIEGSDAQGRPQIVRPENGMLYPKPNGGQRILPPIYSKLKSWWLRATGHRQEIETMNDGHLENTLALLKESTGNLLGKSTSLLGTIHSHMHAQPEIQRKLVELNRLISALDVDDVYPIYKVLASELSMRQPETVMLDIETLSNDIDIAIGDW